MNRAINTVRRVTFRGGWIGLLSGNSKMRTLERGIAGLNSTGYRVVTVEDDDWGWLGKFLSILLLVVTLGFFTLEAGYLIIGEAVES